MTHPLRSLTLIGLCFMVLSACGWHLRGVGLVPEGLESLHIAARDEQSELVRQLKQTLKSANIASPDRAAEADFSLVILNERKLKRTATVNANARVSEQELTEEVEFLIKDASNKVVVPKSTVVVERVFEYDENNVIATRDEEELIRDEMRRDLVMQILNRLRQLHNLSDAPAP